MGDFQVILAAILSPDNETRSQAEVSDIQSMPGVYQTCYML